ncbi:coproporphyrinogen III oxidase [Thalassotalea sp. PLHSN55]|uniref:coproporphyrinogen III oxidase n=1 Tax=Thalassotalea sp. PLHSN55 TaxID=3435888 RepID=UPI003F8634E8
MRVAANSASAQSALTELSHLQKYFVEQLQKAAEIANKPTAFSTFEWLRDEGKHGGGQRFGAQENGLFNRASVNVSQIQYQDMPEKAFSSATALSTIIHPEHPLAPSMHMHISWTELKNGKSYWRIMADLNPSIEDKADTDQFLAMLTQAAGPHLQSGLEQGEAYFYIPALNKHRGVCHFYLEGFVGDQNTPENYAIEFGRQTIDCYIDILTKKTRAVAPATAIQKQQQLDYHTLYFFQVLTLDKGTTAGLLIHDQNDIGTLASLPSHINRDLLQTWANNSELELQQLLIRLLDVVPKQAVAEITLEVKTQIAQALRQHYQELAKAK